MQVDGGWGSRNKRLSEARHARLVILKGVCSRRVKQWMRVDRMDGCNLIRYGKITKTITPSSQLAWNLKHAEREIGDLFDEDN